MMVSLRVHLSTRLLAWSIITQLVAVRLDLDEVVHSCGWLLFLLFFWGRRCWLCFILNFAIVGRFIWCLIFIILLSRIYHHQLRLLLLFCIGLVFHLLFDTLLHGRLRSGFGIGSRPLYDHIFLTANLFVTINELRILDLVVV